MNPDIITTKAARLRMQQQAAHARRSDPWTSHAAAASISENALNRGQLAVLDLLIKHGPMDDTRLVEVYRWHAEGGEAPNMGDSGIRTRRRELADLGLVHNTGKTTFTPSGRRATIWGAVA